MIEIKKPVRVTENIEIVDSEGKTLVPAMTWRADILHLNRQKEIAELIVGLLNGYENGNHVPPINRGYGGGVEKEKEPIPVNGEVKKKRGNPNWYKGMKAPWKK